MDKDKDNVSIKIKAIDGIRGGCAVAIAYIYHLGTIPYDRYSSGYPFQNIEWMKWIYQRGWIFVEMFLVISGFTSFLSYEKRIDDGMTFPQFAIRRAIRIYPLMWATLLTTIVLHIVYFLQHGHTWWISGEYTMTTIILGFLGFQGAFPGTRSWNYPAWSLSIFFLCWIIFYAIVHFTKNRKDARIICCIAMIMLGIGLCRNPLSTQVIFLNSSIARGYISFFSGGMSYFILRMMKNFSIWSKAISTIILIMFGILHVFGVPTGEHTIVFGVIIFPCFLCLCLQSRILNCILSSPPLAFLGKISFSIYLCNAPFEIFIDLMNQKLHMGINFSSGFFFFTNAIAQTVIATVYWKLFEDIIPKYIRCLVISRHIE